MYKSVLLVVTTLMSKQVMAGIWFGSCPSTDFTKTVDFNSYLGRWYEIQRDSATPFETFGSCVTATYSARDDGDVGV